MKEISGAQGHGAALITILIWGTTFVSTKILLADFNPIEILFYRFAIGFAVLWIVYPRKMKGAGKKQELIFMAAGLCGVTLYQLLENIALTYTTASNAGVISSIAPFFTALAADWILREGKPTVNFIIGFFVAMTGIFLISFNGSVVLRLNPAGDLLMLVAAVIWAVYSILVRKISELGYNTIHITRKIFFYGLVFMIPALFLFGFNVGTERFLKPANIFNLLFLGVGASSLCFLTWNLAVKLLGAVKTSVYLYLIPVIAIATSVIVLDEKITWMSALGIVLTLTGLFLSDKKVKVHAKPTDASAT